ncbi:hypothetical protein HGH92_24520 [Chitinophaga varians]|uniref:Uncharacterized protein n=1 Tax=Chitinophaga varians TaxID=2202339 RepID=A0A847RWT5_9BACT|nr:hypothetical protein [Chitinophaga varians]NLR67492.1 hypothetical protein [Chitinophaga varians]
MIKTSQNKTVGYNTKTGTTEKIKTDGISARERSAAMAFVKKNSGNTAEFDASASVYNSFVELLSAGVRSKMSSIVDADDGSGGTSDANNQEHGGQIREIRDEAGKPTGNTEVVQSPSSPVSDPTNNSAVTITHTIDVRTKSLFHSHPSGAKENSSFVQGPSVQDINGATDKKGNPIANYQFGMSKSAGQKVYIYSTNGVKAILPKSAW